MFFHIEEFGDDGRRLESLADDEEEGYDAANLMPEETGTDDAELAQLWREGGGGEEEWRKRKEETGGIGKKRREEEEKRDRWKEREKTRGKKEDID